MAICQKDYCDFMCWTLKGMHVERILHDPSVFSKIKPSLDHFLRSVVLPELLTYAIKDGDTEKKKPCSCHYEPPKCLLAMWRRGTWAYDCMW